MKATITKRLERFLITMVEDTSMSKQWRLKAAQELVRLKGLKPDTRQSKQGGKTSLGTVSAE
jgi:hypothetical protein